MSKNLEDKECIKQKIIEVASDLFAEKGCHNTTVRDICQKAGAYQLSINYHFGNKENLIKEVLLCTYQDTCEANIQERVKGLSPDKQLEETIRARVYSIFSNEKRGRFFKIVSHLCSLNDTYFEEEVISPLMKKYFYFVRNIFAEISEHTFDDFELNYCAYLLLSHISIFNMFKKSTFILFYAGMTQEGYDPTKDYSPNEEQLEKLIYYVQKFVFAGVEKLKQEKLLNKGEI